MTTPLPGRGPPSKKILTDTSRIAKQNIPARLPFLFHPTQNALEHLSTAFQVRSHACYHPLPLQNILPLPSPSPFHALNINLCDGGSKNGDPPDVQMRPPLQPPSTASVRAQENLNNNNSPLPSRASSSILACGGKVRARPPDLPPTNRYLRWHSFASKIF